jgi:hypothetical protein
MRSANSRDPTGVPRSCQPIVHGRADLSALYGRLARAMVAGHEQHHPFLPRNCLLEIAIDGVPCLIEGVAMKVEYAIGFDAAGTKLPIPTAIERLARLWARRRDGRCSLT